MAFWIRKWERMESDMVQRQVEEIERERVVERMVLDIIRKQECRKVKDIVKVIQQHDKSLTPQEILFTIQQMKHDHKITLSDKHTQGSLLKFIVKPSFLSSLWPLLIAVTTLTLIYLTPQVEPWSFLRLLCSAVLVLLAPGYMFINILFEPKSLNSLERMSLSVLCSIAITALLGLILNYGPWGIRLDTITVSLSIISVVLAFCSYCRGLMSK